MMSRPILQGGHCWKFNIEWSGGELTNQILAVGQGLGKGARPDICRDGITLGSSLKLILI